MKKLHLLLLLITLNLNAQEDFNLKWSSRTTYTNNKDGYFYKFAGVSDKYVYSVYSDLETRIWRWNRNKFEMQLVALDRGNMQKSFQVSLKSKKDKSRLKKMKDYTYVGTLVLKDEVHVFWNKSSLNQSDIYVESFDPYLNRIAKLKKVYSIKNKTKKRVRRRKRNLVGNLQGIPIMIQKSNDETTVMIGSEIQKGKDEPVEFDYIILDTKFTEISKGHVQLPIVQMSRFVKPDMVFEYGKDGNIYIRSYARLSKIENKAAKKGENKVYAVVSIVDPATATVESHVMKYDGMNIFNFDMLTDENGVRVYGFFNDASKDASGTQTHGIFSSSIRDGEMSDPNFAHFDAKMLEELFKEDPSDNKKPIVSKKRKKRIQVNDEEALDESYVIETAKALDDDHIVLFCTKVFNYTQTVCTPSGNGRMDCVEVPYCRKRNVTAFKLDKKGEIVWASNVDREKTYAGTNIKDLKIISDKGKFYVIYGSAFHTDAKKLSGKRAKKRKEVRDEFEYAVFDYETGASEKNDCMVNPPNAKRRERKYIGPADVSVMDNQFFVNSTRISMRAWYPLTALAASAGLYALTAVASPLYFMFALPVAISAYVLPVTFGVAYKGSGYMGTIELPKRTSK